MLAKNVRSDPSDFSCWVLRCDRRLFLRSRQPLLYQRSRAMQWTPQLRASVINRLHDTRKLSNATNSETCARWGARTQCPWTTGRCPASTQSGTASRVNVHACSCNAISCTRLPLKVLYKMPLPGPLSVEDCVRAREDFMHL